MTAEAKIGLSKGIPPLTQGPLLDELVAQGRIVLAPACGAPESHPLSISWQIFPGHRDPNGDLVIIVPPERWQQGDCMRTLSTEDEYGRRQIGHFSSNQRLRGFANLYAIDPKQFAEMDERVGNLCKLTNPVPSGQPQ